MKISTRITYCAVVVLIGQSFLSKQLQAQEDDAAALAAISAPYVAGCG